MISVRVSLLLALIYGIALCASKIWWNKDHPKDPRCHMLRNPGCNVSLYKILDFHEAGWFYHAPFRSCRPFYAPAETELCAQNRDLPLTKEECEDTCGEQCNLPDGQKGICMLEGSCKIHWPASSNPRPCGVYNVYCCPPTSQRDVVNVIAPT